MVTAIMPITIFLSYAVFIIFFKIHTIIFISVKIKNIVKNLTYLKYTDSEIISFSIVIFPYPL